MVRWPSSKQQIGELVRARVADKGEDVGEQGLRINVVEFCGLDERLCESGALGATLPACRHDAGVWAVRPS
jgi:hypothetical protein